jgi:hypothetical protein
VTILESLETSSEEVNASRIGIRVDTPAADTPIGVVGTPAPNLRNVANTPIGVDETPTPNFRNVLGLPLTGERVEQLQAEIDAFRREQARIAQEQRARGPTPEANRALVPTPDTNLDEGDSDDGNDPDDGNESDHSESSESSASAIPMPASTLKFFDKQVVKQKRASLQSNTSFNELLKMKLPEDVMFLKILEPAVSDKSVGGECKILTAQHITVANVKHAKFNRDWINNFYKKELRRSELAKKDPRKAIRSKDDELCSLISPGLWNMILKEAVFDKVEYDPEYINSFILMRIVSKIEDQMVKNIGFEPITYDRVKDLSTHWDEEMMPQDAFVALSSALSTYISDSNQVVNADEELHFLFSLMPERYTRYFLVMLSMLIFRNFNEDSIGPSDTPIDTIDIDEEGFMKLVHDKDELSSLLHMQLKFISEHYQQHFNPESLKVMTGRIYFPAKDSNPLIRHLYPALNSVGHRKVLLKPKVAVATVEEVDTKAKPKKSDKDFERKRDDNVVRKKRREDGSATERKCHNCKKVGHLAKNCEYLCGRISCKQKVGSTTPLHSHKDCPKQSEMPIKVRNRSYH